MTLTVTQSGTTTFAGTLADGGDDHHLRGPKAAVMLNCKKILKNMYKNAYSVKLTTVNMRDAPDEQRRLLPAASSIAVDGRHVGPSGQHVYPNTGCPDCLQWRRRTRRLIGLSGHVFRRAWSRRDGDAPPPTWLGSRRADHDRDRHPGCYSLQYQLRRHDRQHGNGPDEGTRGLARRQFPSPLTAALLIWAVTCSLKTGYSIAFSGGVVQNGSSALCWHLQLARPERFPPA